jgi:hypothetical protein
LVLTKQAAVAKRTITAFIPTSVVDMGHGRMDETVLRRQIREKTAAGTLPRTPPPMMWVGRSSWKWKACAVCAERIFEGELEIEYLGCCDPIYFHSRCHELWREECS